METNIPKSFFRKFWVEQAEKQVSVAPLVTLRVILGFMLAFSTVRFMVLGWIEDHYILPKIHFHYFGFEWLPVFSAPVLYLIHGLMLLSAIMVMLGWKYRLAAITLFLTFTYTELIDLTYYLNHYYFVSLACLLLIVVPANVAGSIDARLNPSIRRKTVPAWTIGVFKMQLGLVYFYAGIAKINPDWLFEALPLRIWLPPNNHLPLIGEIFNWEITPYVFSWFGMIYDLTIPAWLIWSKSRPWAYITVIVFHALTGILFQIGVFPLVMIGATLVFFSSAWHQRVHRHIARFFGLPEPDYLVRGTVQPSRLTFKPWLPWAFGLFFLFQVLFPWRFLLYPGNMFWTEQGYRFGWRVMLMEKAGTATFYVKDGKNGKEGEVFNADFLNDHQEKQMAMQPDMILQYAHFLRDHFKAAGMQDPQVRADVFVTLNGQPSRLLLDNKLNLAEIKDGWRHKTWILPAPDAQLAP